MSLGDVCILAALVASAKQENHNLPPFHKIDTISGPVGDPKFADGVTHWLYIPRIAESQALNSHGDGPSSLAITQPAQPLGKHFGLMDLVYWSVSHRLQIVKVNRLGPGRLVRF